MTFMPLFPLSFGGLEFLHASGAVGAVFSPVGFGDKCRAADRTPFPAPRYKRAAASSPSRGRTATRNQRHMREREMLWTHTQGSPSSNSRQFPVIVTALMYQPPRPPVLAVVHAGQVIAHGSAPFCGGVPPGAKSGRYSA